MAGADREHGVRTGTRALAALLATAALVSCGGKTVEVVAAPAAAPSVAPAGNVRVDVEGDEVDVHWTAPLAPVQGYELYLDSRPPIPLPASTTSYTWGRLPAGTEHLVQVVAVGEDGRSRPVEASFTVPWKAQDAPDESTPAAAAPAGTAQAGTAPAGTAPAASTPAASTPAAAAPARPASPAPVSPPAPATFTVRGTLTMYNSIPNSVDPVASCSTERTGLRLEVKDGAGAIVTLATLQSTTPREVEQDDYAMQYSCDFPYSLTLDGASPVYTLRAYYEGIERIEPWTTTLGVAALRSSPPKPYLSFCLACG